MGLCCHPRITHRIICRMVSSVFTIYVYESETEVEAMVATYRLYGIWARFRLPITGRPDLAQVMEEKKSCKV